MNNLAIHGVIWSKSGINGLLNQKEFHPNKVVRESLLKVNQKLEAEIIKRTASVIQLLDSVQSAVSELCVYLQIAAFSSRYNLTRPKLIPVQESRPQGLFWSLFELCNIAYVDLNLLSYDEGEKCLGYKCENSKCQMLFPQS